MTRVGRCPRSAGVFEGMWLPDLASARGHGDVLRALCCWLPRSAVCGKRFDGVAEFWHLPEYRGLSLGRLLWRAAMHWGQQHHAAYQLLQTQVGGASDRLWRSEGLTDLGLVSTTTL
jgi:GNAT superfamily N-acetyltransferase